MPHPLSQMHPTSSLGHAPPFVWDMPHPLSQMHPTSSLGRAPLLVWDVPHPLSGMCPTPCLGCAPPLVWDMPHPLSQMHPTSSLGHAPPFVWDVPHPLSDMCPTPCLGHSLPLIWDISSEMPLEMVSMRVWLSCYLKGGCPPLCLFWACLCGAVCAVPAGSVLHSAVYVWMVLKLEKKGTFFFFCVARKYTLSQKKTM